MLNNKYVYIEKLSQKGNYNTVDKGEKSKKKKEREIMFTKNKQAKIQ